MSFEKFFLRPEDEMDFLPIIPLNESDQEDSNGIDVPAEIALLPLRNTVLFPGVVLPITVGRDKSIKAVNDAYKSDKLIGVVAQKDSNVEDPSIKDLESIGTVAKIVKMIKMPDGGTTVIIQGKSRFVIDSVYTDEPYFKAKIKKLDEEESPKDANFDAYVSTIKDLATEIIQLSPNIPTEGIANGRKALAIATENKIDAKLPMIHTALAHNYERAGNYREAAESYKILNSLKDSLYKDANPKALAEIQTKYETVKKEQQIEQQKNKIARQNLLFIGFALLAILLSLLFYSQYKRYRLKKEAQMQSEIRRQQELATKAVMQAEENERQRIAKDLHDGVGQMMSAAKMNLSAFESEISFDQPDQKRSFEKVIQLVDESCREVRTVSHIMMPNALMKNNLSAAIHAFVEKLDKKSLQVHVYTEGLEQRLDSNTELVLYRVLQECVNNVIRHAGASTLDISVTRSAENIVATVEDNGRGFDITDKTKPEGMGLKNIRARVEYLKGTVDIDSIPGQGTVIAIHVPL